jgi:hypothetical protein
MRQPTLAKIVVDQLFVGEGGERAVLGRSSIASSGPVRKQDGASARSAKGRQRKI